MKTLPVFINEFRDVTLKAIKISKFFFVNKLNFVCHIQLSQMLTGVSGFGSNVGL